MNELAKMGFVYEITHIAPNGEEIEKQIVHNIMINEGITNFLRTVFNIAGGRCYKRFIYGFTESSYIPLATDTIAGNNALDLYEMDYNETIFSSKSVTTATMVTTSVTMGKDNQSVAIGEGSYTFWGKKTLTGVVLIHDYNGWFGSGYYSVRYLKQMFLISAAQFKKPIQVEPNGKVRVKSNFIILPA